MMDIIYKDGIDVEQVQVDSYLRYPPHDWPKRHVEYTFEEIVGRVNFWVNDQLDGDVFRYWIEVLYLEAAKGNVISVCAALQDVERSEKELFHANTAFYFKHLDPAWAHEENTLRHVVAVPVGFYEVQS